MGTFKTPGVYITERNAFPNSVTQIESAVPAFVGWTQKAVDAGKSISGKPTRVSSFTEFEKLFGGSPIKSHTRFSLALATDRTPIDPNAPLAARDGKPLMLGGASYSLRQLDAAYLLHHAMSMFFTNGGGNCYVVSVGEYGSPIAASAMIAGIDSLKTQPEPTLLVVPEAVRLPQADCQRVQAHMLQHCGLAMTHRFAILDVWEGYRARSDGPDVVEAFRSGIGTTGLSNGAAYYPWLHSIAFDAQEITYCNIAEGESRQCLKTVLTREVKENSSDPERVERLLEVVDKMDRTQDARDAFWVHRVLQQNSAIYRALTEEIRQRLNILPPSAAMAGVYTLSDTSCGVWQAPAHCTFVGVLAPTVTLSDQENGELNVSLDGKSVNAIRTFPDKGTLVWGARTLDGNSMDWRYVSVRRTCLVIEESCRIALRGYAIEPNAPATWVAVKTAFASFLREFWLNGALQGNHAEEAFTVDVGLGETMTEADLAAGNLRVVMKVAVSRPAEYIEITLTQLMRPQT